jgi:hypothetical protein
LVSPAPAGSIAPRLTSLPDGRVLLSWLEPHREASDLRFALWRAGQWSPPMWIAANLPFATHPSEAPGIVALSQKNLIAYWMQHADNREKYPEETDVLFAVSSDGGLHWSAPTVASLPKTDAESSYASGAAIDGEHASLVWLDGRDWKAKKRVTLRSGIVKSDGSLNDTTVLDADTCTLLSDCLGLNGHRRSKSVSRSYQRKHSGHRYLSYSHGLWAQPKIVHPDQWRIAGCPVHGPVLDSDGKRVAIAWFTGAGGHAAVQVEISQDGQQFSSPVRVDLGNPVGRTQILLQPRGGATVLWLENQAGSTQLLVRNVSLTGKLAEPVEIARGSGLGYPKVARTAHGALITWTEEMTVARVHVASFDVGESSRWILA